MRGVLLLSGLLVSIQVSACAVEAPLGEVGVYIAPTASELNALQMTIHDFKIYDANDPMTNPDFHNIVCERDVAASALGTDGKPVYQAPTNTIPTFGKKYFDQWYHDAPGVNEAVNYPLLLAPTADGQFEYDSRTSGTADLSTGVARLVFFPIDDGSAYATTFGNQGSPHNYAFTGELHALFTYPGQGSLRFRADDDLYVFIDKTLVVNLGGIHGADGMELDASALGLTAGSDYALDLFYAERAGKTGDLLITTSFALRPASML